MLLKCPQTSAEVDTAVVEQRCTDSSKFHCFRNQFGELVQRCMEPSWIQAGSYKFIDYEFYIWQTDTAYSVCCSLVFPEYLGIKVTCILSYKIFSKCGSKPSSHALIYSIHVCGKRSLG